MEIYAQVFFFIFKIYNIYVYSGGRFKLHVNICVSRRIIYVQRTEHGLSGAAILDGA